MNMNDRMKQLIDSLLESLNKAAMGMYEYEVGLPIYDEDSKAVLRGIVLRWLEDNFDCRFKQWGGVQKRKTGRLLDGRVYDEMPRVKAHQ